MAQNSRDALHRLVALIRADGRGELREGMQVERFQADNADDLRGEVMMRAIERAQELGTELKLRTIDIDGVYPLIITPDGNVDQEGEVEPLQPGDSELLPEDYGQPLHETLSLPRSTMMAALQQEADLAAKNDAEASAEGEFDAAESDEPEVDAEDHDGEQLPELDEPADSEESPDEPAEAADSEPATDEVPIVANLFGDGNDDNSDVDEYHDEGLDHDFADIDDDISGDEPADGAEDDLDEPEEADTASDDASEAGDWTPRFARDESPAQPHTRVALGGPQAEYRSAFPEQPLFAAEPDEAEPEPEQPAAAAAEPQAAHAAPRRTLSDNAPTLDDFFAGNEKQHHLVAERGWRANLRKLTGGLISLGPGARERAETADIEDIQRSCDGPRTIVVVNPKGGAHKTTTTLMIAAMFGMHRGGYTLAWDNNETRGTLGWRSKPGLTKNTAVDLLRELPKFEISGGASINELDQYVRNQGHARFDVLASDDDAASAAIIDDDAFSRLHRVLSRFYRIMVIDTGNNMRASNWEAAVEAADQLVIVSTARDDTAASAAWLADGLRERGQGDKLANAVTILSSPSAKEDRDRIKKLRTHFSQLTRTVVEVPYDEEFVGGGELDVRMLQPATRDAWRRAVAEIARGL